MLFEELPMIQGLWGLLILGLFLWWGRGYRLKRLHRFAQPHLMNLLTLNDNHKIDKIKRIFLLLSFFFSVLALARPQWGFEWREIKRQGLDIYLAVDISKSMLTEDVRPNRLERTKLAIKDLLKSLKGDRVGLIAFAGESFLICPLTVDYGGFLLSLNDLNEKTISRGGTNMGKAMEEAIKGYEKVPGLNKAVIMITDGDNLEGDPLSVAKKAKEKGIKVYCVGIGTKEGDLIRVLNEKGEYEFLKDAQGNVVKSRLNESPLQQIALTTEGIYVRASGAEFGLDFIYEKELAKFEKREFESKMEKKYFERFQIPLSIAFLFLLWEIILVPRTQALKHS